MARVAIATLGCKVNQVESAGMLETLCGNGYSSVPFSAVADLYIINTCAVTGRADYQSRQLIRRAVKKNPGASVLVTGCYAQVFPGEIAIIPGVTLVAGNVEKDDILHLVEKMAPGGVKTLCSDIRHVRKFSTPATGLFAGRTRGLVKIQDGCDTFCRYCIVPYARGKSRSLPVSEVLKRLFDLGVAGYRELILTGINLGSYGRDLSPATSFFELLQRIGAARLPSRLRLSSLEPREITGGILAFLREHGQFCRHLHIPLQSGDDRVLALMGRNYDTGFFRHLVTEIQTFLPDVAIGIDIMVGFPGEGEEEFSRTLRFLEELPLAYLHVFPYSRRPGTPAASFSDQVAEAEKKKRVQLLRQLSEAKRVAFAERFLGKRLSVLLEGTGKGRDAAWMQGFSSNYLAVAVKKSDGLTVNTLVEVEATEMKEGKLIGQIVTVTQEL